ncbi:MAG: hypothetical protein BJ554DRAFT_3342, partial [Olpidium bornovanus]
EERGREHAPVDNADQLDSHAAAGAGGGGRSPAKKAKAEAPAVVHSEHKQELSEYINHLAEDKLETVIEIIHESIPHLREAGTEEVELDIDALDYGTFYNLYNFVVKGVRPAKKTSGRGGTVGREGNGTAGVSPPSRPTGGDPSRGGAKTDSPAPATAAASPDADAAAGADAGQQKKKVLSDAEQTRKISELEEKLKQFADVPSGCEAPGGMYFALRHTAVFSGVSEHFPQLRKFFVRERWLTMDFSFRISRLHSAGRASSDAGYDSGGDISDGSLA